MYFFMKDTNKNKYYVKATSVQNATNELKEYGIDVLGGGESTNIGEGNKTLCDSYIVITQHTDGIWQPLQRLRQEGW